MASVKLVCGELLALINIFWISDSSAIKSILLTFYTAHLKRGQLLATVISDGLF